MPNRGNSSGSVGQGLGGRDQPRSQEREPNLRTRPENPSFGGVGFVADDARLGAELDQYDRQRRFGRPEYTHEQNYRPGYHEGGARFGFFGPPAEPAFRPQADQEFDPDYLGWRGQKMQLHDSDYAAWRREQLRRYDDDYWKFRAERREDFHQRFQDWRAQREAESSIAPPAAAKIDPEL